jgi:hypothetical protein
MPPDINIACGETETLSREIGEIEDQPRKMARTPSRGKRLTLGWRARQSPRYGGDRFGAKAATHKAVILSVLSAFWSKPGVRYPDKKRHGDPGKDGHYAGRNKSCFNHLRNVRS